MSEHPFSSTSRNQQSRRQNDCVELVPGAGSGGKAPVTATVILSGAAAAVRTRESSLGARGVPIPRTSASRQIERPPTARLRAPRRTPEAPGRAMRDGPEYLRRPRPIELRVPTEEVTRAIDMLSSRCLENQQMQGKCSARHARWDTSGRRADFCLGAKPPAAVSGADCVACFACFVLR